VMMPAGSPRLSICFPLEGLGTSGGVRIVVALANGFVGLGHTVTIFAPDYAPRSPFPIDPRVDVRILRTMGGGALRKVGYLAQLCWWATVGFDVVYATGFKTAWYIVISRCIRRSHAMLAYLLQGYDARTAAWNGRGNPLSRALLFAIAKSGYWLSLRHIAVSDWVAGKTGRRETHVIPAGISLSVFRPVEVAVRSSRRFVVGTVASRAPAKGYAVFLDAIGGLPDEAAAGMQVVVASFENVSLPTKVEARLLRPTSDEDLVAFYHLCDVFVFASYMEGFGLPPLEAMACGVPVVTTECGGVREFASEQNALMIPPGRPDLIRDAILRLQGDSELRERLRRNGIEVARQFSVSKMVRAHEALLTRWHPSVSDRTASFK